MITLTLREGGHWNGTWRIYSDLTLGPYQQIYSKPRQSGLFALNSDGTDIKLLDTTEEGYFQVVGDPNHTYKSYEISAVESEHGDSHAQTDHPR
jgi:hypothetical protein